MPLILTQEGIERIWEFAQDPYLTDEESEADSILRRLSEWRSGYGHYGGLQGNQASAHQAPLSPVRPEGPYPFEKETFIQAMIKAGWKEGRRPLEKILSSLYDVGYIDDVENVQRRTVYQRGRIHSPEHTTHFYGDLDNREEWSGRLKEVYTDKTSPERYEYIKRLYPDRFPD
tara:strand:+ start:286 stop:804 length:519 start_codon:yes stop_codon:yes gene_type:complete